MKINKLKGKIEHHLQEVVSTKTSPHALALGFAIGTFISILPTPGFNILLGLIIVLIFKKISKFSLFAGILFWNPLTAIPIYYFSYQIGDLLFGNASTIIYEVNLWSHAYMYARRFLVGNAIIATTMSITSYFVLRTIVTLYYKKNHP